MVYHSLRCAECGEKRVGRDTADGLEPVRRSCQDCGATDFVRPSAVSAE